MNVWIHITKIIVTSTATQSPVDNLAKSQAYRDPYESPAIHTDLESVTAQPTGGYQMVIDCTNRNRDGGYFADHTIFPSWVVPYVTTLKGSILMVLMHL